MAQSIKDTNKDDKGNLTISDEAKFMPRIKPPSIANCYKFPEIHSEDCNPLWEICSKYFSFNEYSFIY